MLSLTTSPVQKQTNKQKTRFKETNFPNFDSENARQNSQNEYIFFQLLRVGKYYVKYSLLHSL